MEVFWISNELKFFMMRRFKLIFAFAFISLFKLSSQTCAGCGTNVASLDSSAYTVNSGETFCIDSTGNFIGTLTLNGGTVCNKGLFAPKAFAFSGGTINNYGNATVKSSLSFDSSSGLNNGGGSILNIVGNITVAGGAVVNDGIMNVDQSILNNSGSLSNSSIINCSQLTGGGSLTNTGAINKN
jgi:hypothetical protein